MATEDYEHSVTSSIVESGAILLHLNRAVQRATTYPADHPSIPLAVSSLMRALEMEWKQRTVVTIGIARDRFIVNGQEIDARHGALAWLARKLSSRGLASIAFSRGAPAVELVSLAAWLGGADEQRPDPQLNGIALDWADGSPVRSGKSATSEIASIDNPVKAWRAIIDRLTADWFQGDASALPDEPEELAATLSAAIERNEGVGFATLTSRVVAVGLRLPDLPHDISRMVRPRLAVFVARLSPDLRRELLRVDARSSADKLRFLTEMADALPDATLMEVLADFGEVDRRVRREIIVLLEKLVGLSIRDPFLRELTETKLISFGLPRGMTLMESSHVRQLLEKRLRQRSDRDWNGPEYVALLEDVSRRHIDGERRSRRYSDEEPDGVRSHVSSILLRLLVRLPEHPDASRYLKRLRDDLQRDLERGRFASLFEIASSLNDLGRLRLYLPEELPPLIDGYFADMRDPGAVGHLMTAIEKSGDDVPEELEKLFVLIGAEAGAAALDRMAALKRGPVHCRFARLLTLLATETFANVATRARLAGGAPLRALLEVLALPEAPLRLEIAFTFLDNRDSRIRLSALRILVLGDDRPEQVARYLERGLRDSNQDVRRLALELAPQRLGDGFVDFMAGFLRGRPAGKGDLASRQQAVAMLEESGTPQARSALRALLLARRYVLRPGRVRLAQSMAKALERLGGDDEKKAVSVWRRSLSGRIGRCLGPLMGRR